MKNRILIAICAIFMTFHASSQIAVYKAKQLQAIDSIKLVNDWIKSISKDSAFVGVTDRDIPSALAVKKHLSGSLLGYVPITRTINGYPLSSNISLNKTDVGLGNVDNTSDANKPVSTAQAASIATKQATLVSGSNIKTVNSNNLLGSGDISVASLVGFTPENAANKNANNGYAGLDAGGKVPFSLLPATLMVYKGLWDATTNSPSLSNAVGTAGHVYKISNSGGQYYVGNRFGIVDTLWDNDFIIYNGSAWEVSGETNNVKSINGQQGIVTLTTSNISEGSNLYYTDARVAANTNVAANTAARHTAASIGTANGLSLVGQQFSLALATASTPGALSAADWNTFNNKQNALGFTPYNATNPAGYISSYTETDPLVYSWAKQPSKPTYSYLEVTGTPILGTYASRSSGLAELSEAVFTGPITAPGGTFTASVDLGFNNQVTFGAAPYKFKINRNSNGYLETYFDDEYDVDNTAVNFRFRTLGTPIIGLKLLSTGGVILPQNLPSTSTSSGTLVVGGGVGIAGAVNVGGIVSATGGFNSTAAVGFTTSGRAYSFQDIVRSINTGADFLATIEGISGGGRFSGSTAYASVLGTNNNTPLEFGTNNIVRGRFTGSGLLEILASAAFSSSVDALFYKAGGNAIVGFGSTAAQFAPNSYWQSIELWTNGSSKVNISSTGAITASSLAGTGDRMVVANSSGVLSTQAIPSAGTSGTYTPTLTYDNGDLSGATATTALYTRVGNIVTVTGAIYGVGTSPSSGTGIRSFAYYISLPITQTNTNKKGTGVMQGNVTSGIGSDGGRCFQITNNAMYLDMIALYSFAGNNLAWNYTFSYEVN